MFEEFARMRSKEAIQQGVESQEAHRKLGRKPKSAASVVIALALLVGFWLLFAL